jgi:hypothetical protein
MCMVSYLKSALRIDVADVFRLFPFVFFFDFGPRRLIRFGYSILIDAYYDSDEYQVERSNTSRSAP